MARHDKRSTRNANRADPFRGIDLSPYQLAGARARMAQAEAIAAGTIAAYNGIAATAAGLVSGIAGAARRVRSAFMRPAHH